MHYQPRALDTERVEPRPVLEDITVVIPTLGRAILEEALVWIAAGSAWPGSLIVVHQGTDCRVACWIETLKCLGIRAEYLPSTQRGKAAALNRGIERVETRFVVVTDDDCFVDHQWLSAMETHLRETPGVIITGPAIPEGDEMVVAVVTSSVPTTYRRPRLKPDTFCGSNMGTEMTVIERIGPFDEDPRLLAAEDCEWAYRALKAGVPIIYVPEVSVRHYGWRDESRRAARYREYARSHGGFYGKYIRQGDWLIALRAVLHHGRALRRFVRGAMSGDQEMIRYGWSYLTGLMPGIIAGWRQE